MENFKLKNIATYKTWTLSRIKREEIPIRDRMSRRTIDSYCLQINALFNWARKRYGAPEWIKARGFLVRRALPIESMKNIKSSKCYASAILSVMITLIIFQKLLRHPSLKTIIM